MTVPRPTTVDEILDLYDDRGGASYGEDVTQLTHALQCAQLAAADGASTPLVAAALLHDVGHLLVEPDIQAVDDHHEAIGARVLARLFGVAVSAPVALHVCAKRWRCATDPGYVGSLSDASVASLAAQGGPLTPAGRARFEAHPAFADAVALRRWDDLAKDPAARTVALRSYEPVLRALARDPRRATGRTATPATG